jgi:hypothetical protein
MGGWGAFLKTSCCSAYADALSSTSAGALNVRLPRPTRLMQTFVTLLTADPSVLAGLRYRSP